MAGITLAQAGEAIVYPAVPWSKRLFSLKTRSFPKGSVPRHLVPFLFKKGGVPASCARETEDKAGATRIHAMNACVSAALRK
ncbi:unnamed protein product [marine sediment metagenome]|uniref:Uncharacterized protein n=1 Tax=marine sediment metagenome TaxID=412755 RepID=X1J605_9ZZZZ